MIDFLSDKPLLHLWLILCGIIVTLALLCALGLFLLEILKGFVLAVDFHKFRRRVATHRKGTYKFGFRKFCVSWGHFIGWHAGSNSITLASGDRYQGFRNYVILGHFVSNPEPIGFDDPDFEDDDEEPETTSDQKRP